LTNLKPNELEQMFIIPKLQFGGLNYRELWETLKHFDGHREFKPFSVAPELEYKTLKECMDTLEKLSAQGLLAKILGHRKQQRPWEFGCSDKGE